MGVSVTLLYLTHTPKRKQVIKRMKQKTLNWWINLTDKQRYKIIEEAYNEKTNNITH